MDDHDHAKIWDFLGLAKLHNQLKTYASVMTKPASASRMGTAGSVAWMAPELVTTINKRHTEERCVQLCGGAVGARDVPSALRWMLI